MDDNDKLLIARFSDLAERSFKNGIYTNTSFLSMAEQEIFHRCESELRYAAPSLFGGSEECERKILRFGSEESLGYEGDWPIRVLFITPLMQKFADDLTHRDFLGAVLNLGIERQTVGDIFVRPTGSALFCMDAVAETILSELTRIRHTSVKVEKISADRLDDMGFAPEFETLREPVASDRADLIIARICRLSRSNAQELFAQKLITINGRIIEKPDVVLKDGDVFTVRGYGKYIFDGVEYVNKKGKNCVLVRHYK